jgi:hypothetical protein
MARLVVWFAAIVLLLQLLGATHHRHDLAHQVSDCAGCMLAAQPPSPPAPHIIPEIAVTQAVLQYLLVLPLLVLAGACFSFLIPHAQAPPTFSM